MNDEKLEFEKTFRAIAADQDLAVAQMQRSTDGIAEEAMRRAWTTRHRRLLPYVAVAGLASAAAFGVTFLLLHGGRKDLHFEIAGRAGQTGAQVTAEAGTPLPLQFSDGSKLVFQPGARARVARLTDHGAELSLEGGRLLADVRHTGEAHWSVSAGPFTVLVTGTRFAAEWSAPTRKLSVQMFEGSVLVEGPSLGGGLALRAGETLDVGVSSLAVVTRTVQASAAPRDVASPVGAPAAHDIAGTPSATVAQAPIPQLPAEAPAPAELAPPKPQAQLQWSTLAGNGRYADALRAAEHEGFPRLCGELDAEHLLALGDVARYASSLNRARQAFHALVRRFPRDQRSQDARFALGRVESEAGEPVAAAKWFESYLADGRNPPLAEEAAGRLIEIYDNVGNEHAAAEAGRAYLARHPKGPRAALARKALAKSAHAPEN